ncbi:hypothetical protein [Paenibacillus daejeonensis]|uniref:hypothetical protein n=1 Tax=Paenibacillus daejeonensis TaxID=135193 RepID=UPI00035F2F14|nr:hypothetical protein [Paenibacillus daejeonensis]
MKKDAMKWALLGGVVVFLVLYGIEVVTSGIGTVYGPLETSRIPTQITDARQEPAAHTSREDNPYSPTQSLPVNEPAPVRVPVAAAGVPERISVGGAAAGSFEYRPLPPQRVYGTVREPSVNRVAEQTAGMLQTLSNNGIRMVVSVFDSLTK